MVAQLCTPGAGGRSDWPLNTAEVQCSLKTPPGHVAACCYAATECYDHTTWTSVVTVTDQIDLLNHFYATSIAVALVLETCVKTSHKACHTLGTGYKINSALPF